MTHAALEGFAGLGTLAVVLLTITGLVNSAYLIGFSRLGSLLTTPYGVLLILKLVLFAGMLALAASNRFVLTPHLGSALEDEQARPLALRRLRRSLALETVLAAMLLLIVAIMGTQAPPAAMM